ncbi:MAG: XdhC family protein [Myxococcota bacterium]
MDRVHETAQELEVRGEGYVLATVIRAVAPTSAKPGDKAVITEAGVVHGWVGGSCAEPTVKKEAELALADGACRVVQITPEPVRAGEREGLIVVPMTCYSGGELEIYLEPHVAKRDLVVFGNSPVSEALIQLGVAVGYRVTVVDLTERPPLDGADVVKSLEALTLRRPHEAAMVVATHGVFDEEALCHALELEPEYLGVVASPRRFASLRGDLRRRGVEDDAWSKVDGPAGIDIGATTPSEIALSILAAITANRQSVAVTTERRAEPSASPGGAAGDATLVAEDSAGSGSCCHD